MTTETPDAELIRVYVVHAWARFAGDRELDRAALFYDYYEGAYADYSDQFGLLLLTTYLDGSDPVTATRDLITDMEERLAIQVLELDHELVTADDITRRMPPEATPLLDGLSATRGPDGFPAPLGRIRSGVAIWDWRTVNGWLRSRGFGDPESSLRPSQIAEVNAWITSQMGSR